MLEKFMKYLIQQGYSEYTPSGNPSTVYDYAKRIQKICHRGKLHQLYPPYCCQFLHPLGIALAKQNFTASIK